MYDSQSRGGGGIKNKGVLLALVSAWTRNFEGNEGTSLLHSKLKLLKNNFR